MPPLQKGFGDHDRKPERRRLFLVIGGVLVLGTLLLYGRTGGYPFVQLDDQEYVGGNRVVQKGLTVEGLRYAFTETGMSDWYPGLYLSFMADVTLFGPDNPRAHHLVSVGLHISNVLLLFGLLVRWTSAPWRSAVVAALFAFHPLQVESVAWISARKDVLSTFFWLLAMGAYGFYIERRESQSRAWPWYLAVTVLLVLGCLTKANLVALPLALLLLDGWPLKRFNLEPKDPEIWKRQLLRLGLEKVPWLAVSLVIGVVHLRITDESVGVPDLSLLERGAVATVSYAGYLVRLVRPLDLACWYPHPAAVDPGFLGRGGFLGRVAASAVLLGAITAVVVWQARRRPYLMAGWLWYLVTLAPASGLVTFAPSYLADRYAYVPLWGLYWMLAWWAGDLAPRWSHGRQAAAVAALAALAACVGLSWRQVRIWRDSHSLFTHALAVTEQNPSTLNNLAASKLEKGRWEEAVRLLLRSIEINPDQFQPHYNLGTMYGKLGDYERALKHLETAIALRPDHAETYNNIGVVRLIKGDPDGAITAFQNALRHNPHHVVANVNLAALFYQKGRLREARLHIQRVIASDPAYPQARQLERDIIEKLSSRDP